MNKIKIILGNGRKLVGKSHQAVCGISEREVIVPREKVRVAIKQLQKTGHYIVGTSHGKTPTKKIWFIRGGTL